MTAGFVSGLAVRTGATLFTGEATCTEHRSAQVAESTRRGSTRMMVDNTSKEKSESFLDWLHNKIMHNFTTDYGYETYFKPVEKAREQEMERVRDEVDTEDAKK